MIMKGQKGLMKIYRDDQRIWTTLKLGKKGRSNEQRLGEAFGVVAAYRSRRVILAIECDSLYSSLCRIAKSLIWVYRIEERGRKAP